eukprot:COSAG04_NODE_5_length_50521_cov_24.772639_16_plen_218_part_00
MELIEGKRLAASTSTRFRRQPDRVGSEAERSLLMRGVPLTAWKEPRTPVPQACQLSSRPLLGASQRCCGERGAVPQERGGRRGSARAGVAELEQRGGGTVAEGCAAAVDHRVHVGLHDLLRDLALVEVPCSSSAAARQPQGLWCLDGQCAATGGLRCSQLRQPIGGVSARPSAAAAPPRSWQRAASASAIAPIAAIPPGRSISRATNLSSRARTIPR